MDDRRTCLRNGQSPSGEEAVSQDKLPRLCKGLARKLGLTVSVSLARPPPLAAVYDLGKGIGVDEYEYAAEKAPNTKNQFKAYHKKLEPRAQIRDHLVQILGAPRSNVENAMMILRDSTRQALHEGWLS